MRHPHDAHCSSLRVEVSTTSTRFATTWLIGDPIATNEPSMPRRRRLACSITISWLPVFSPPRENPCTKRKTTRIVAMTTPRPVGSNPMAMDASPIIASVR